MIESNYEIMVFFKIIGSIIVGFAIGFFRRNRPAGIRTFTLICLGATLFTITSISSLLGDADPSRVIASIVTGIGFLGVGVIWKANDKLIGMTTAATIWVSAAIGIQIGLGEWFIAIMGTLAIVLVLLSKNLTKKLPTTRGKKKTTKQLRLK